MSTELPGTTTEQSTTVAPATGAPPDTSGHIDPADYDAVRSELARYQAAVVTLNPHAARIKQLVEDPNAAQIFDDAVAAYQQLKDRQQPQVPAELRPIVDKISVLENLANEYQAERKAAAEKPQREFQDRWNRWQHDPSNERFYNRMVRENPDLKQRDLQYLAQVAAEQDFAPLEDVWKQESWRFVKEKRQAPPSSLRSDAGEVGIPGPSAKGAPEKTIRERTIELERERLRAS